MAKLTSARAKIKQERKVALRGSLVLVVARLTEIGIDLDALARDLLLKLFKRIGRIAFTL